MLCKFVTLIIYLKTKLFSIYKQKLLQDNEDNFIYYSSHAYKLR